MELFTYFCLCSPFRVIILGKNDIQGNYSGRKTPVDIANRCRNAPFLVRFFQAKYPTNFGEIFFRGFFVQNIKLLPLLTVQGNYSGVKTLFRIICLGYLFWREKRRLE